MPPSTKRKVGKNPLLAAPYARFKVGDRVTVGGMQQYRVIDVTFNERANDWLVHGQAGVLHFFLWQGSVNRVS